MADVVDKLNIDSIIQRLLEGKETIKFMSVIRRLFRKTLTLNLH